jgi:hypothetical protein
VGPDQLHAHARLHHRQRAHQTLIEPYIPTFVPTCQSQRLLPATTKTTRGTRTQFTYAKAYPQLFSRSPLPAKMVLPNFPPF